MGKFVIALAACLMGVGLHCAPAQAAGETDLDEIKALEERFVAAVNAKDIDAIMSVYIPDESLLVFDLAPPRQYVGAAAYRKNWEDFIGTMSGVKFEVTDFDVTANGELAYAHSIHHFSATDNEGQEVAFTVRVSDVYRKIEGQWLVVHEHVSVPIDLATGEPDMSSKP